MPVLFDGFAEVAVLGLEAPGLEALALGVEALEAAVLAASPLRTLPHASTEVLGAASGISFCDCDSLENFSLSPSSAFYCDVFWSKLCIKVCAQTGPVSSARTATTRKTFMGCSLLPPLNTTPCRQRIRAERYFAGRATPSPPRCSAPLPGWPLC